MDDHVHQLDYAELGHNKGPKGPAKHIYTVSVLSACRLTDMTRLNIYRPHMTLCVHVTVCVHADGSPEKGSYRSTQTNATVP